MPLYGSVLRTGPLSTASSQRLVLVLLVKDLFNFDLKDVGTAVVGEM
jgi:hypothetical protein